MAEQDPGYGSFADFPVVVDPAVTRVFDFTRTYQKELDINPAVPKERLQEMLVDLNGKWPFSQETVRVSGTVRSGVVNYEVAEEDTDTQVHGTVMLVAQRDEDGSPQVCDYTLNDQLLWSDGFVMESQPFMFGKEEIGKHHVIKLLMSRTVFVNIPEEPQPCQINLQCLSDIDGVALQPQRQSQELARLLSHEYFPGCAEMLEALDTEEKSPADILMALRDVAVPAEPWVTLNELESLSQFAYEISGMEYEAMPFLMSLHHDTPLFDTSDEKFDDVINTTPNCNLMITTLGLRARPRVNFTRKSESQGVVEVDPTLVEFRLIAQIRQRDQANDSGEFEVRLADIELIKNAREAFYSPKNAEEDADITQPDTSDQTE